MQKFLYHTTSAKNLPSIQSKGLIPHKRPFHPEDEDFVYLGDWNYASTFGDFRGEKDIITLAIDVSKLDTSLLAPDRNVLEDLELEEISEDDCRSWEYKGVIPWSACQEVIDEIPTSKPAQV